jgi:16S rRNA (cytosine1402-N4)-methyltransferase
MKNSSTSAAHVPVMLDELVSALAVTPGGMYVDCTVGAGGHAEAVLEAAGPGARLLGIDADPRAIAIATGRLERFAGNCVLVNDSFGNLQAICSANGFSAVNGIYFDLGVSSMQMDEPSRGFSFQRDEPLDMRLSQRQTVTAADVVNTYPVEELARVIWAYGEERKSRIVARRIAEARPVKTTGQLAKIVERALRAGRQRVHPATRVFQAIRICVNDELRTLERALAQTLELLRRGGRVAVISFHSLEDRIVKNWMRAEASSSVYNPDMPLASTSRVPTLRIITRSVLTPGQAEIERNPRSRSAKLRVAERL